MKDENSLTLINRMLKLADTLGLDKDELMEMTVLDAILKIEDTKTMWKKLREEIK
jgi:hypothetical protein